MCCVVGVTLHSGYGVDRPQLHEVPLVFNVEVDPAEEFPLATYVCFALCEEGGREGGVCLFRNERIC